MVLDISSVWLLHQQVTLWCNGLHSHLVRRGPEFDSLRGRIVTVVLVSEDCMLSFSVNTELKSHKILVFVDFQKEAKQYSAECCENTKLICSSTMYSCWMLLVTNQAKEYFKSIVASQLCLASFLETNIKVS